MKKRLISLFTLLFVICSTFSVFAARDWTYDPKLEAIYGIDTSSKPVIKEEKEEDAVQQLLSYLGLIGAQESLTNHATVNDLIGTMSDIAGVDAKEFRSGVESTGVDFSTGELTFAQAAVCGIFITGWDEYGRAIGGYPGGYMQAALEKELFKGITAIYNQPMMLKEFNQFIYNVLLVPTKVFSVEKSIKKYSDTSECLLVKRFGLRQKTGILNAVGMTNIYGVSSLDAGQVELDRVCYRLEKSFAIDRYVGHRVVAYVDAVDDSNIMALAVPYKSTEAEFTQMDIEEYDVNCFRLEKGRVRYQSGTRILLNGLYHGTAGNGIPTLDSSAVLTAIDNTEDGIADVLSIWNYEHFLVASDVGERGTVAFQYGAKYDGQEYIIASEDKGGWNELEILKNNVSAKVTDILAGDVVSVAAAMDGAGRSRR